MIIRRPLETQIVVEGGGVHPLGASMRVGRQMVDDDSVGRLHCFLEQDEEGLLLIDLGNAGGTFVNGQRVETRVRLHVGDVVRVGARRRLWFEHTLPGAAPERTPEEARLVAGVLAAAAEDAPRLVYADWLLERGDPRGELIRFQIEGRHDLAKALLDAHELAWLAPLRHPLHQWVFRGGFLGGVRARAAERALAALAKDHPVTSALPLELRLRPAQDGDVAAVTRLVNLAYLVEASFVRGDRTDEAEVRGMMRRGSFLVAGEGTLAACVYVEERVARAYLGMLAVDPMWQGARIGRAVVEGAEAWARALGCRHMDLLVIDIRTELRAWYGKLGYEERGQREFVAKERLLRPVALVEMAKQLT